MAISKKSSHDLPDIHSFMSNIYMVPLQRNYSEAHPTPTRPQRTVLGKETKLKRRSVQVEGPTTEKTRLCQVEVQVKGTRRRPCSDEQSDREPTALRVELTKIGRSKALSAAPDQDI